MRLPIAFALVAVAALSACGDGTASKGAARAPIAAAPAQAPTQTQTAAASQAPNCPTVQPACPPARAKAADARVAAAKAWTAERKVQARHAVATRQVKVHATGGHGTRYARVEAGLPDRPYRYDELGPGHDAGHDERRYEERRYGRDYAPYPEVEDHAYARREARRAYRHHDDQSYRGGYREERYEDRYAEAPVYRHEERRVEVRPLPPTHDTRRYAERRDERIDGSSRSQGVYRHESYSESYSESRRSSGYAAQGPCCLAEAAGFDARGYLTWPGKVPAR